MKLVIDGDTVRVSAIRELGAANAQAFGQWVREGLNGRLKNIEIDLSQTGFIDSVGLGALVTLYQTACRRKGAFRLLRPQPAVAQMLSLTQMDRIFEVVRCEPSHGEPQPSAAPTDAVGQCG